MGHRNIVRQGFYVDPQREWRWLGSGTGSGRLSGSQPGAGTREGLGSRWMASRDGGEPEYGDTTKRSRAGKPTTGKVSGSNRQPNLAGLPRETRARTAEWRTIARQDPTWLCGCRRYARTHAYRAVPASLCGTAVPALLLVPAWLLEDKAQTPMARLGYRVGMAEMASTERKSY